MVHHDFIAAWVAASVLNGVLRGKVTTITQCNVVIHSVAGISTGGRYASVVTVCNYSCNTGGHTLNIHGRDVAMGVAFNLFQV